MSYRNDLDECFLFCNMSNFRILYSRLTRLLLHLIIRQTVPKMLESHGIKSNGIETYSRACLFGLSKLDSLS
jgi:hypothetical protein